jgi:hypothetical protein
MQVKPRPGCGPSKVDAADGRGLLLVQNLSDQWGYLPDEVGRPSGSDSRQANRRFAPNLASYPRPGPRAARPAGPERFPRSRIVTCTGVPANPNSSRSLRSMNRR